MARPQVLSLRLDPDEHLRLSAAAQAAGLSPSAWCRRLLLDQLATAAAAPAPPPALTAPPPAFASGTTAATTEPLARVVAAKLTASQYFDLDVRAKSAGVTIGAYLRRLVQGQPPTPRWPLARKAIVELSRVGNNLNQLTKLAHEGTPLPADLYAALQHVLAQVRAVRKALLEEPQA